MTVLERVREREHEETGAADATIRLGNLRAKLKQDLIQSLGLSTVAKLAARDDVLAARTEMDIACQTIMNTGDYADVSKEVRETVVRQVLDEICGLGPLQPLLDDPTITEVMINGCEEVFYEQAGEIHPADRVFDSADQIMLVIDRILAPLGRRLDKASPIVNARLQNGDRVNAVAPPIAIDGPAVTIRKFSNRITSLSHLEELGSVPHWYALLLAWAVRARQDIAVAGGTGSGKTTLLNALSCEIGLGERIITIEDSAELRFDTHPNVVRLEARDASLEGTGEVTIRDLVKNALRMRPDRIVVGEVRGAEAIDMLQAMNTGHDGSLTTLHAGTAQEAVSRLVLMARFGMDLPTDIISEQISTALDLIVMSRRVSDGSRYLSSLTAVGSGAHGEVTLQECVSFDEPSRSWSLVTEPAFVQRCVEDGSLSAEEVTAWRSSCT
ncbi:MAG: CpaF family protein [Coriobacteriales bacterium]|nr:CpaF family protein [Coriobacteriales bacterium]